MSGPRRGVDHAVAIARQIDMSAIEAVERELFDAAATDTDIAERRWRQIVLLQRARQLVEAERRLEEWTKQRRVPS